MKTSDFLRQHDACREGAKWALSISDEMSDVWDAMIKEGKHEWLIWTATRPGVFSDRVLCKLACRFVRETPLADGRKVWDLLIDERSRMAVVVAERYADGKATDDELKAACDAAVRAAEAAEAASYAAHNADYDAACAYAAARAAYNADYDAACAAAYAARASAYAAYAARSAACSANAASRAAYYAAYSAAARAACDAYDSANAAADAAAWADAALAAAHAAARTAQVQMIAEMGNPFKK